MKKFYPSQTLMEVILAIALASMVLVALIVLGSIAVKTTSSSSRRNEATKLSVSGLEAVRYSRDNAGFESISEGCYSIDMAGALSGPDTCDANSWAVVTLNNGDTFDRKIEVAKYPDSASINMIKVTVTSRWLESGGKIYSTGEYKEVVISTVLSNWVSYE